MMITELEGLRMKFEEHKNAIVDGLRDELDKKSVGDSEYQSRIVLDEVRKTNEEIMEKMKRISNNDTNNLQNLQQHNDYFSIDDGKLPHEPTLQHEE